MEADREEALSRWLAWALRHDPDQAGIDVDAQGWADLDDVVRAAGRRHADADEAAVRRVVEADPKDRYEIDDGRIRATYGHSIDVDLGPAPPAEVPDVLYHGTDPTKVDRILEEGLRPMDRNEVHLSATVDQARQVGRRHCDEPVVLEIDAVTLVRAGYEVHRRGEGVWTVERVPPGCLAVRQR